MKVIYEESFKWERKLKRQFYWFVFFFVGIKLSEPDLYIILYLNIISH